jgi:N-acetylglucosamine kinase-like BadF-type ATPase
VAVVSGAGLNAIGRAPDGRTARFAALGDITGERGGGGAAGLFALAAAVKAQEGRGPRTALERVVPAFFGLRRPLDVSFEIAHGRLDQDRLRELSPLVFRTAIDGDVVARGILDGIADEIVSFVDAAIRRLRLAKTAVPVVLAGGIFKANDCAFVERIADGVHAVAPRADVRVLAAPPVLGAALYAFDMLGAGSGITARLRSELSEPEAFEVGASRPRG